MNGVIRDGGIRRLGWMAALLLSAVCLKADPIPINEGPPMPGVVVPIVLAVLAEAICIGLMLRRWRRPHLFILWLMGMHLLTYPLFLGWLWLAYGTHPALAAAVGEGLIVLLEGWLIYLICRFISSRKSALAAPSLSRSLFASLVGNVCSAVTFPLLTMLYAWLAFSIERPDSL